MELSREFAGKLSIMLRASLINYKYYEPWCDEIILSMEEPPLWIIDLTCTKYYQKSIEITASYAYSEPFADFQQLRLNDFYIACLFEKYRKRHIAWNTFLLSAGSYSDGNDCCVDCEYFYELSNRYEDSEYSPDLERKQSEEVGEKFYDLIKECDEWYEYFLKYYRLHIAEQNKD